MSRRESYIENDFTNRQTLPASSNINTSQNTEDEGESEERGNEENQRDETNEERDSWKKKAYEVEDERTTEIRKAFEKAMEEFEGTDPTCRPPLRKLKATKKVAQTVSTLNETIIPYTITPHTTFTRLQTTIYCAAMAAIEICERKFYRPTVNKLTDKKLPAMSRLERNIESLRKDLSRINEYLRGQRSRRLNNKINSLLKNSGQHAGHNDNNHTLLDFKDTFQQKLGKLTSRLQRYNTTLTRRYQNRQFTDNEKYFYRNIRQPLTQPTKTPPKIPTENDLTSYWTSLWSKPTNHRESTDWIREEERRTKRIPTMNFERVTEMNVTQATKKSHNWKAPGPDQIHNYWLKQLTCTHRALAKCFTDFIRRPQTLPAYLTKGTTYMIPKGDITQDPTKYRPITCLPTMYKTLTSILTDKIYAHVMEHNILAEEQKGCRRQAQGCKEQVLIDAVVLGVAKKRNISTTYIDYQKAFDSVPHTWLQKSLQLYKINPTVVKFLSHAMTKWGTTLRLTTPNQQTITTEPVAVRRGIFQGDSLSPLLFCLAMNPLSNLLNSSGLGIKMKTGPNQTYAITHLLYMDDIKLYSSDQAGLEKLIGLTEKFSTDIGMTFGLDKCKTQHVVAGSRDPKGYECENGGIIQPMGEEEMYKYLGFLQSQQTDHHTMKQNLKTDYTSRLTKLLRTKLNGRNMIKAINTFAVPVLTYSFGVVKWTKRELKELQARTNRLLTKYHYHHPKAASERVTLPRSAGGRGLIDLHELHTNQTFKLKTYFEKKAQASPLHQLATRNDKHFTPLNLAKTLTTVPPTRTEVHKTKQNRLESKVLHGRYQKHLADEKVDRAASHAWLSYAGIYPETEGFMIAIQDETIATKNYKKYILHDRNMTNDACRLCGKARENIQHITSACMRLAGTDYTHRHNQVGKIIHQKLARKYGLTQDRLPYYKYEPKTVLENDSYRLYWDRTLLTDKTVHYNRPDITLIDKKNKLGFLIDIAVPNTHNLDYTIVKKRQKYADLGHEIKRSMKLKRVETVPLVISATGVIPKALHAGLKRIDLPKGTFLEMQKAVILNTCRITRKFLDLPEQTTVT
ncbi:RNA-directed DNA polymerase [Streptomyces narbonensis]|uniref:RNA-directed DNA polymerase n=1 Tax=Streptomyces narbonensis TaxID=67333 RepID=UPI001E65CF34|nr:reverse transcriptase family protein [Streptomyces narbonensis]